MSGEQGRELARELRLHYIETSAKTCLHVEQAFHDVARLTRKFHDEDRQPQVVKPKKRKGQCSIL